MKPIDLDKVKWTEGFYDMINGEQYAPMIFNTKECLETALKDAELSMDDNCINTITREPMKIVVSPEFRGELVKLVKELIIEAIEPTETPEDSIPISYIEDKIKELKEMAHKYSNHRYSDDAWVLQTLLDHYSLQKK